jgi:predicted nucleotidyltransferase
VKSAALPDEVADALGRFRTALAAEFGAAIREVRLFGSHARGDASDDSDIDVLVILDWLDWERRARVLGLAGTVLVETGLLLSPTVIDLAGLARWQAQGHPLWEAIESEGVLL